MDRRTFLRLTAAVSVPGEAGQSSTPEYRLVSRFRPGPQPGMPGRYPGRVIRTHSAACVDTQTERVNADAVRRMFSSGMSALTGAKDERDAWAAFFEPSDIIGIKVNCSGAPNIRSSPEVVGAIADNLVRVGVAPEHIWIYERFPDQIATVHYDRFVPSGVHIEAVEEPRGSVLNYDPNTYVEVDFFGEEDTRSNMIRRVSEQFTKIINVPNMKDHGAAGVTGCLKNIAYGNFSNVARSHYREKTNTLTFIGTLASMEPLRSRTVLHVMDGIRGVWQGGPFLEDRRYQFFPKQIVFGTDPVAMDRLLLDVIENERRARGALSVWDRSMEHVSFRREADPRTNHFIREPGHIEYAAKLGLGVYDIGRIHTENIEL